MVSTCHLCSYSPSIPQNTQVPPSGQRPPGQFALFQLPGRSSRPRSRAPVASLTQPPPILQRNFEALLLKIKIPGAPAAAAPVRDPQALHGAPHTRAASTLLVQGAWPALGRSLLEFRRGGWNQHSRGGPGLPRGAGPRGKSEPKGVDPGPRRRREPWRGWEARPSQGAERSKATARKQFRGRNQKAGCGGGVRQGW